MTKKIDTPATAAACCRIAALFIGLFLLISCGHLEFRDISSDPNYSFIVGKKIQLKEDVLAHWISYERNWPAQFIDLIPGRGIGGQVVLQRTKIQKGTIFQITKVEKAKFTIGKNEFQYVVKELGGNQISSTLPIQIWLSGDINDSSLGLDPAYYEIVP